MVRNYKRKTEDRWSKEDLLEALVCIKDAKLKINDAARQYGISRATLYRQYQKFILAGGKCDVNQFRTCGGNPILTKVEEDVLEKTIWDLRKQGFTVTSSDIKRICFEYCDSNGIPNQFNPVKRMASDDWYYGFLRRHPDVKIQIPAGHNTSQSSASSTKGRASASSSAPNRAPKLKKIKSLPAKKTVARPENRQSPSKSVSIVVKGKSTNRATAENQQVIFVDIPKMSSVTAKGKKQMETAAAVTTKTASAAVLKKPFKRSARKVTTGRRGWKSKSENPSIPILLEQVKEEIGDMDDEEIEEQISQELQMMETEEKEEDGEGEAEESSEESEEEEDEDEDEEATEDVQAEVEVEDGEVEMADEEEDEQDEAEKSDSEEEEEEEGEEEDKDGEDAETAVEGEDGDIDQDGEEVPEEEGDEEDDEEEELGDETQVENGSDGDYTNDVELLEKLLDM